MVKAVAFYPEYIKDVSEIEANLIKIKQGGIEAVRFGEFAWGLIEPAEGQFNFEIFDRTFELLNKHRLRAVLCTPTACPPAWLCRAYPDILPVHSDGRRIGFGARQHRCYHSPEMRRHTERVVRALAERYGREPALLAWQIDNELAAEHKYCYCDACLAKFRQSLQKRYGTVEALNARWFSTFWAQDYQSFDEVPFPKVVDAYLPMRAHPSLTYAYLRFSSERVVAFSDFQAGVIRAFSDRPVTTNQDDFYYGDNVDWYRLFSGLDFVAFDIYSQKLYEIAFYYDMARGISPAFWQMEFSSRSPILAETLALAREKGCGGFGLFAFNPFPAGQEEGQFGLVDIWGEPAENYAVFRDFEAGTDTNGAESSSAEKTGATLVYDFASAWIYNAQEFHAWESGWPQIFSRLVYKDYLIHTVYKALFELGTPVRVTNDAMHSADPAAPLVLPMHIAHDAAFAEKLLAFIRDGGTVLATDDLFQKNEDNAYFQKLPAFFQALGLSRFPEGGRTCAYGDGKIVFVDRKTDEDGWKKIIGGTNA